MRKNMGARRWLAAFLLFTGLLLAALSAAAWAVDPFFQFRVRDNRYKLFPHFVAPGLIQNGDYDTLILGSSVTQNFDMERFREKLGVRPLHIGLGGLTLPEAESLLELAHESGRYDRVYFCADLYLFSQDAGPGHIPAHLLRGDPLSKLRYLLSYEVWFRFIPGDAVLLLCDRRGVEPPEGLNGSRSIDMLGNWAMEYSFGRDIVLDNYRSGAYAVSGVETDGLYERMTAQMDDFLARSESDGGELVFFFPPYSALYWVNAQEHGYFEPYLQAKRHFIERAAALGAAVYDFQGEALIADLELYKDTTHYGPEVNDWMTDCFADGTCLVTGDNRAELERALIDRVADFRREYAWFLA